MKKKDSTGPDLDNFLKTIEKKFGPKILEDSSVQKSKNPPNIIFYLDKDQHVFTYVTNLMEHPRATRYALLDFALSVLDNIDIDDL